MWCEKEQDVIGEGGQHFLGTDNLVLTPGDKHSTVQCKHRSRSGHGLQGMTKTTKHPQRPLTHFNKGLKEQTIHDN